METLKMTHDETKKARWARIQRLLDEVVQHPEKKGELLEEMKAMIDEAPKLPNTWEMAFAPVWPAIQPQARMSLSKPARRMVRLLTFDRYQAAALLTLASGIIGLVICGTFAIAPLWVGFLVAYGFAFALMTSLYTVDR